MRSDNASTVHSRQRPSRRSGAAGTGWWGWVPRPRGGGVRWRATLAAGAAAALAFGGGALWLRHTVFVDQLNMAVTQARADAVAVSRGELSTLSEHAYVFTRKGQIIGSRRDLDPFARAGVLPLPAVDGVSTIHLGRLPGTTRSPLEGRTVTVVSVAVNPIEFVASTSIPIDEFSVVYLPEGMWASPMSRGGITALGDGSRVPDRLVVLASPAVADEAVSALDRGFLVGLPLAVLFVAATAWLVTGRALRPVDAIRAELADITATDLDRRVPVPRSRDVVGRLATTTNETLDRLAAAIEAQRRFVADAAHELRSPVAILRTQLEVALAHPDRTAWPATGRAALSSVERLQSLTEDLLMLATAAASAPGEERLVDLAAVAEELAAERDHPVGPGVRAVSAGPTAVRGDEARLARLIGNLLDNAVRHARAQVTIAVATVGDEVELTVTDDGPGVEPAERERVFERFARLDDARGRDAGGAGLGLAIARDIATRHGGRLVLTGAPGGGARFVLSIPIAEPGPMVYPVPPSGPPVSVSGA